MIIYITYLCIWQPTDGYIHGRIHIAKTGNAKSVASLTDTDLRLRG